MSSDRCPHLCRSGGILRMLPMSAAALAAVIAIAGCRHSTNRPTSTVDVAPFQAMAELAPCTEVHNRLFLIDDSLVFWSRAGHCADAAYADILYEGTIENVACEHTDSMGGPIRKCHDTRYQATFDTILGNLDQPDLGLGSTHRVVPVPIGKGGTP